jgi:hypothetical protein
MLWFVGLETSGIGVLDFAIGCTWYARILAFGRAVVCEDNRGF